MIMLIGTAYLILKIPIVNVMAKEKYPGLLRR